MEATLAAQDVLKLSTPLPFAPFLKHSQALRLLYKGRYGIGSKAFDIFQKVYVSEVT